MATIVRFELFITGVRFLGITNKHLSHTQQELIEIMNLFTGQRSRYQLEAGKLFEVSCMRMFRILGS